MLHGVSAKGTEQAVNVKSTHCEDCGCYIYYSRGSGHFRKVCRPCGAKRYKQSQRASARKIRAGGAADWNAGKRAEHDTVSVLRLAARFPAQVDEGETLPGFCIRCKGTRLSAENVGGICDGCQDDLAEAVAEKRKEKIDY